MTAITIRKETRHGTGGNWVTDAEAKPTARGFLKVAKAKSSAQSGVGGYLTRICLGNRVLLGAGWPTSLKEAESLLAYAAQKQDAEHPIWADLI
jgi:hypothetical protein